jgi:hypothetical protein
MTRELSDEAVEHQARHFLDWHRRRGGFLTDAFLLWSGTKDFYPADRAAILRVVLAQRRAA